MELGITSGRVFRLSVASVHCSTHLRAAACEQATLLSTTANHYNSIPPIHNITHTMASYDLLDKLRRMSYTNRVFSPSKSARLSASQNVFSHQAHLFQHQANFQHHQQRLAQVVKGVPSMNLKFKSSSKNVVSSVKISCSILRPSIPVLRVYNFYATATSASVNGMRLRS